jgi:hypothetical protein
MNDDDKQPFDLDSPEAIRAMNIRQAKLGALAQEIALAGLLEIKQKMATGVPLNMGANEAEKLLDVGLRLERAARGLPEDADPLPDHEPLKKVN